MIIKRPVIARYKLPPAAVDMRIGLYGGSFNPVHHGHVHLCEQAQKLLRLDAIWCMVTPQNPLKTSHDLLSLNDRLQLVKSKFSRRNIYVTALEKILQSKYSIETITKLRLLYPQVHFVWLMGADNLICFDKWYEWRQIAKIIPMAIFDRPPYSLAARNGRCAKILAPSKFNSDALRYIVTTKPARWCCITMPRRLVSASQIRAVRATLKYKSKL